jgi:hypothetical protein
MFDGRAALGFPEATEQSMMVTVLKLKPLELFYVHNNQRIKPIRL